jgi:hypothetical protein
MTESAEEKMVELACNALTVAGQEMGEGDHWPVIEATVQKIKDDWEEFKIERAVDAELKTHLYQQLEIMERGLKECTVGMRIQLAPKFKQLRELYDAYFTDTGTVQLSKDEIPMHIKRARVIVNSLETEEDGE